MADGFRTAEDGLNHFEYSGTVVVDAYLRKVLLPREAARRDLLARAIMCWASNQSWVKERRSTRQ